MLPHVPYSFVARICALREVVGEHLDPTSQQLHQAMCVEALNFWTSSYPPWLVSLSWCPWQAKTHILEHSTFPFASLGCSSRFAANWAVWGGGITASLHKQQGGKESEFPPSSGYPGNLST